MSKKPILYIHHVEDVLELFYRTELREGEEIINNHAPVIAKELNLRVSMVNEIITRDIKRKIKVLNDSISVNHEPEAIEELEVEYSEVSGLEAVQNIAKEVIKKRKIKENFSIDTNFYFNP